MASSLIKSTIFEHCLITLKLEILKIFPQLGLFTRCSAMDNFFIALLTAAFFLSFLSLVYEVVHLSKVYLIAH